MADDRQPVIVFSAIDQTGAVFASVRSGLNGLGDAITSAKGLMLSLAGALGVTSFSAGVKAAADAADAAAKMGDRFGIATETLIGMQHASDLAGVSNEGLTAALRGIAKSGVDAARGGEEAAKAYRLLHINASEFVKLPMNEQLSVVIDKLGQVENVALRNALAQQVMGKQAGEAMGLVADGSEAFEKAAADAEAWGLAINRVDAAKIEIANEAIKRAEAATKGLFTQIALAVGPGVKTLADYFADSSAAANGFRDQVSSGTETAIQAIGYLANWIQGLRFAWTAAKLAVAEFFDFTWGNVAKLAATLSKGTLFSALFTSISDQLSGTVIGFKAELDALAEEGLPADKIIAQIRKVTAAMDLEAKKIAARRLDMMRGSPEDIPRDKGQDAFTQRLAQQLEQIAANNELQLEALRRNFETRQGVLDDSLERGWITQEFWEAQSALTFSQFEAEKTKILDEELKKCYGISNVYHQLDAASTTAWLGQMAQLMQSKSRAMFEVGKAAAIGETIFNTYRAAQGAYAAFASIPIVGPAMGIAAAAAAIVAGLARVQQIRATTFGGGPTGGAVGSFSANPVTGVPTAPIGAPITAAPAGPSPVPTMTVNIITNGNIVGNDGIDQLVNDGIVPALQDLLNNRDGVLFNSNSRQASVAVNGI